MKYLPKAGYKRYFFNPLSVVALFFILSSWVIYLLVDHPTMEFSLGKFLLFGFISYTFWTFSGALISFLNRKIALIFYSFFTVLAVFLFFMNLGIYMEFKEFFSNDLYRFLSENPVYFNAYLKQTLSHPAYLVIILLSFVFTLFMFRKFHKKTKFSFAFFALIIMFIIANWRLNTGRYNYRDVFMPMDIHTLYTLKLGYSNNELPLRHQYDPDDKVLKDSISGDNKYNIILIVMESVSRYPIPVYGYDNNYMPFLKNWFEKEKPDFVLFRNAMAVSAATDVSMPTLYKGTGPAEDYNLFVKAPFIWDYVKQKNYHTMIATSQSQEWKKLKFFVNDQNLDQYFYPENLELPIVHDVGADDLSVLIKTHEDLLKLPSPFFFYYNTNATHLPYQNTSPHIKDFKGIKNRYGKSLYITDQIIKNIVQTIRKRGDYERSIFIITADHGNITAKRKQRLSSFYEEALDIPMLIKMPESWIKAHPKKWEQLKENENTRVTNLDITPTIYELLYSKKASANPYFTGNSLLDSIDNNRLIIALSTNDYRSNKSEGFGLYKAQDAYLLHDDKGLMYFDLKKDSTQIHNILKTMPAGKRKYFDSVVNNNKYLRGVKERLMRKWKNN